MEAQLSPVALASSISCGEYRESVCNVTGQTEYPYAFPARTPDPMKGEMVCRNNRIHTHQRELRKVDGRQLTVESYTTE